MAPRGVPGRRQFPGDDIISALASENDGPVLDADEVVAKIVFLLFAGHETVTGLLGNALVAFAAFPEQRALLRCKPALTANSVEELLRFDRPDPKPLSFGFGTHHCLGAPLARLEIRIAMPAVLKRLGDYKVDKVDKVDKDRIMWKRSFGLRGPPGLPLPSKCLTSGSTSSGDRIEVASSAGEASGLV
jgi:cytochrome P450